MTNDELLTKLLETYVLYHDKSEEQYELLTLHWVRQWIHSLEVKSSG